MKRNLILVLTVCAALMVVLWLTTTVGAGRLAGPAAPLAGAPTVVSYQGQIVVAGTAYSGTGYFKFAVVDAAGATTYWSNDGTSVGGAAPTAAVALSVTNGLFNVLLGDTTLAGMTQSLPASAFSGTSRYLRVWFSSDNVTFTQLSPDRRIAAVPYALQATNADFLDGEQGSYYLDATNLNAGTVDNARFSAYSDLTAELYLGDAAGDLARNNGALQATLNADLLDGSHASAFQQKYDNVVVVAKSGGDYTTIGAALTAISDAAATNRYLVWVAPGVYTESVTMEPYVDIQGAGELVTKITYQGSGTTAGGTVIGADNAELRFLTVENTGGNTYAIAINNTSASPRITHVTCIASGGASGNYGVRNTTGSPVMTHVLISIPASGVATAFGVYNLTSSAPELTEVTINVSGNSTTYGIRSETSSTPTLRDVTVRASGGSANTALRNESPVTMLNVVASASGGAGSSNYGVYNTDQVTMTHVTASAAGGNYATGVYNSSAEVVMLLVNASGSGASTSNKGIHSYYTSTVTMTQVIATASGGSFSYAVQNERSSSATMMQVTANATGASSTCYGVYNDSSEFTLNNSTVSAKGGAHYGVYNIATTGTYTVTINNSQITGSTATIRNDAEFTTRIGASQLAGGNIISGGVGKETCIGVYDENYVSPGYNTCP